MKSLIIINDQFEQMAVGKSSNLAYILSCLELGFETYIYKLPPKNFFPKEILATFLDPKNQEIKNLITTYKEINFEISKDVKVGELVKNFPKKELLLNKLDLVIQRLEPMKSPFPPAGNRNFNNVLKRIRNAFPNHAINLPINLGDKSSVQKINRILATRKKQTISIPTQNFKITDLNFIEIISKSFDDYKEFFPQNKNPKIVIKPQNSAQSYGVFAMEKSDSGFDLQKINNSQILEIVDLQNYKIDSAINQQDFGQILEILLCAQSLKTNPTKFESYKNKKFSDLTRKEIREISMTLYNGKILSQPFLEGVKEGDIRSIFLKNSVGDFYLAGHVFRKNIRKITDQNFTTSYSSGNAKASSILELTTKERADLHEKCANLLFVLNGKFREKYKNSLELGVDFILVGNHENLLLSEINHTCPALMPIAESLEKKSEKYDGGLFYIKKAILDVLKIQDSELTEN